MNRSRRITFLTFFALATSLAPGQAFALRAARIESAAVTSPGKVVAEFGHQYQNNSDGVRIHSESFTLSSGIQGGQQVDLVVPWRVHHSAADNAAMGDVHIMHKAGAMAAWAGGRTLLGSFSTISLPTSGESRVGKNNYIFGSNLILTRAGEHTSATLNAGAIYPTNGSRGMRYGAGLQHVWTRVGLFSEIIGFTDFQDNGKNEIITGAGGMELLLGQRFTFDISGEMGVTKDAPDWGISSGATLSF